MKRFLLLAVALALTASAWGEVPRLYLSPTTPVPPGGALTLSLKASQAARLTVGRFTLTLAGDGTAPVPTVTEVKAGDAVQRAATPGCLVCAPAAAGDSLLTAPALGQAAPGDPLTVAFALASAGPVGVETGGVTGSDAELAQMTLRIPESAPVGTNYAVRLSNADFSDAASQAVAFEMVNGTITVGYPPLVLREGTNTAYHDARRPGPLLIPTSGDDPATPETEIGFPGDDAAFGHRRYLFAVEAENLADSRVEWSATATRADGSPAPDAGTVVPTRTDGLQVAYLPPRAAMLAAEATRVTLTARVARDPGQSVVIEAELLPYGDANLDGRVTRDDYLLALRWASGLDLPDGPEGLSPTGLTGYVPSPVRRLLVDVRPVPGLPLPDAAGSLWDGEFARLGRKPPPRIGFNRDGFPFGDGRITLADALWVLRKATLHAETPPRTLDPSTDGTVAAPL